jgi:hypothetical protein
MIWSTNWSRPSSRTSLALLKRLQPEARPCRRMRSKTHFFPSILARSATIARLASKFRMRSSQRIDRARHRNARPILILSTTLLVPADEGAESSPNLLHCICRLMAHSGHTARCSECLLSGVKRTSASDCQTIAISERLCTGIPTYRSRPQNWSGDTGRYSRSFGLSAPFASPPCGE